MVAHDFAEDMAEFSPMAVELTMQWARRNLRFRPVHSELVSKAKELTDLAGLAERYLDREARAAQAPLQLAVVNPVGPERVQRLLAGIGGQAA